MEANMVRDLPIRTCPRMKLIEIAVYGQYT